MVLKPVPHKYASKEEFPKPLTIYLLEKELCFLDEQRRKGPNTVSLGEYINDHVLLTWSKYKAAPNPHYRVFSMNLRLNNAIKKQISCELESDVRQWSKNHGVMLTDFVTFIVCKYTRRAMRQASYLV